MTFPDLIENDNIFSIDEKQNYSNRLNLDDILERQILVNPSTHNKLYLKNGNLTDGEQVFDFKDVSPILYPSVVSAAWINGLLPLNYTQDPLEQYLILSQIKQSGEINAPLNSIPSLKHQWRYHDFCKELVGVVLDIGSDKPSYSIRLLPKKTSYIGLDPYAGNGEFRLIALGEVLPIASCSIDAVTFNTSLDHILDYHTAVEEAYRVLKIGGFIVIATYAWLESATLLTDLVHFHHFREYEIIGALNGKFQIYAIKRYEDPKLAKHRYGLYIMARKK